MDQVVLGTGALAFILSFFHFLKISVSGAGSSVLNDFGSAHENAWHGWGLLGMLLILVATGVAAVRLFAPATMPKMPVGINLLTLGLVGLGFLFLVLHWLANIQSKSGDGIKVSEGLAWSGWLLLLVVLAMGYAAFTLFKKSGEVMPDLQAMQAKRAVATGTTPPPPPAAYPPATPTGNYTMDDTQPPASSL